MIVFLAEVDAMRYTVVLLKEEDGGYVASVPVLPGCVSQGDTRAEALRNIEEAIEVYLEDVRASGESVPIEDERSFVEIDTSAR
jgi:predicted RNase H-like HicB family nuclease